MILIQALNKPFLMYEHQEKARIDIDKLHVPAGWT